MRDACSCAVVSLPVPSVMDENSHNIHDSRKNNSLTGLNMMLSAVLSSRVKADEATATRGKVASSTTAAAASAPCILAIVSDRYRMSGAVCTSVVRQARRESERRFFRMTRQRLWNDGTRARVRR